jgi:hypothetical protein
MRGMDSREGDKEEGRGLGRVIFFFGGEIMEEGGGKEEEIGRKHCFGELLQGHYCCWEIWARRPRELQGLMEIGSRRGCS